MDQNNPITEPVKKKKRQFFLAVIGIALALMLCGDILGELLTGLIRSFVPMSAQWKFLLTYLSFIGIDVVVLLYCRLAERDVRRSFRSARRGGSFGNTLGEFALGILIGFVTNGICILAAWLHGDLHFSVGRFEAVYLLAAFVTVLIQSAAEELLTRGYMLGALRERYGVWIAVAINSLFFGALHLANPGVSVMSILDIVVVGVALSVVVVCRGSLWMAIAIHTMWNFTQNFLFGLPNSGIVSQGSFLQLDAAADSVFYDAVFGVEGALPAVLVDLALAVAVVLLAKRKAARAEA